MPIIPIRTPDIRIQHGPSLEFKPSCLLADSSHQKFLDKIKQHWHNQDRQLTALFNQSHTFHRSRLKNICTDLKDLISDRKGGLAQNSLTQEIQYLQECAVAIKKCLTHERLDQVISALEFEPSAIKRQLHILGKSLEQCASTFNRQTIQGIETGLNSLITLANANLTNSKDIEPLKKTQILYGQLANKIIEILESIFEHIRFDD